MFRQLFSALKSGDVLDEAFAELGQMLEHAQWMFVRANDVLRRQASADEARDKIYECDKQINDLLRSIRRKIVRHLTINPGVDVAAGLALMSVAKDAERIGDYCKNVFEVGRFYKEDFQVTQYHEPLEAVRGRVEGLFVQVQTAFLESDSGAAKTVLKTADGVGDDCDRVIEHLLIDEASIQTHEAVAYSLLARHYKRVSSHLANIATAVLGKVEELDFRP
ncbi:MAG: phosphate signaling complex PhoU family protein [Planctomycetota bacterium]|jgi:phosphate uptake regulator